MKKKLFMTKTAALLLTVATVLTVQARSAFFLAGEPELPKSLNSTKKDITF